jgi:hypothetical protein
LKRRTSGGRVVQLNLQVLKVLAPQPVVIIVGLLQPHAALSVAALLPSDVLIVIVSSSAATCIDCRFASCAGA